jgi:hypothetical protein
MGFALAQYQVDDAAFWWQLRKETERLRHAFMDDTFADDIFDFGVEVEFHLLDEKKKPKRIALEILRQINKKSIVPEAYSSMIELNSDPFPLAGEGILNMHHHLLMTWRRCAQICRKNGADLIAIGTLPTFTIKDINEKYLTQLERYQLLNEQLNNVYCPTKRCEVTSIGPCSAFQVHLRVPVKKAVDYYNAGNIATAPVLAISGNSPYLLQSSAWQETRIRIFESLTELSTKKGRVFLGDHYLRNSLYELFRDNLKIPMLLTLLNSQTKAPFWHAMLHNSTIWRWNRPVISLDSQGPLHVRIEHRSLPAGPTVTDMLANTVFWVGLTKAIGDDIENYTAHFPFNKVKSNFYAAAEFGFEKPLFWPKLGKVLPQKLIVDTLLPLAYKGLQTLDVKESIIKDYLEVIYERARKEQTGSCWQQAFMMQHPGEWAAMTGNYMVEQQKDKPVAQWKI